MARASMRRSLALIVGGRLATSFAAWRAQAQGCMQFARKMRDAELSPSRFVCAIQHRQLSEAWRRWAGFARLVTGGREGEEWDWRAGAARYFGRHAKAPAWRAPCPPPVPVPPPVAPPVLVPAQVQGEAVLPAPSLGGFQQAVRPMSAGPKESRRAAPLMAPLMPGRALASRPRSARAQGRLRESNPELYREMLIMRAKRSAKVSPSISP